MNRLKHANITKDNTKLRCLSHQDQLDRAGVTFNKDMREIFSNDKIRRAKIYQLIENGKCNTASDFCNAALIFLHGHSPAHFWIAHGLSQAAMKLGSDEARWLCAASLDRALAMSGFKQKFGTQYIAKEVDSRMRMVMMPFDKRTSDRTRARLAVPPFVELLRREDELTLSLKPVAPI